MPAQPRQYTTDPDTVGAWADARATAEFAALVAVSCQAEGHDGEFCSIRETANEIARRALDLARELAHRAVEVAA